MGDNVINAGIFLLVDKKGQCMNKNANNTN